MMRKSIAGFVIAFSLQLTFAQDIRKSYSLPAGGHIVILTRLTRLANIKVTGYEGKEVEIAAYKKGPDRDSIDIKINNFGNKIEILSGQMQLGQDDASVDLEVRVPQAVPYTFDMLSSLGGNVEVSNVNVQGWLKAESVLGNVEIKDVRGPMYASSHSGNVNVDIDQIFGYNFIFSSSGNVSVRAPAKLDASIEMRSDIGLLKTDFPIEIREDKFGAKFAGRWLGRLKPKLRIGSVHGQVSLVQK
jgi:hypothetical protein